MILQKSDIPNYRILQVEKNRFDGEVGQQSLAYNKDSKRYFELNKIERDLLIKEEGNVTKTIERRIEKLGCVEPFYTENRNNMTDQQDDKRRLMMKDKVELIRQMNLSKIVRKISSDLDMYQQSKAAPVVVEEASHQKFGGNSSEDFVFDDFPDLVD